MADIHKEAFIAGNLDMFSSAKYSDLTVRCGPDEYKLHRVIVCARSKFFAKACDGQFREAKTATIDLADDDPQTVKRMLTYLYTLEYDDGQRRSEEEVKGAQQHRQGPSSAASLPVLDQSLPASGKRIPITSSPSSLVSREEVIAANTFGERMMANVLVYALADKYDIPELKLLAKNKFSTRVGRYCSLVDLSTIANAVFTTTPANDLGLREIVINVFSEDVQAALECEDVISTMEQHGSFASGVLRHIAGRLASVKARLVETSIREEELAQKAQGEKVAWLSGIDMAFSSANNLDECRRCHADFSARLERTGSSARPTLQLSCTKCSCKHGCEALYDFD